MGHELAKIRGQLLNSLVAAGIKWMPKTDEEWAAAEHLFVATPNNEKPRAGRQLKLEDAEYSCIFMAWLLSSGIAQTRGKPSVEKAAMITGNHLAKYKPSEDGDVLSNKALRKRWDAHDLSTIDWSAAVQANDNRLSEITVSLIMKWEMEYGRDFFTMREKHM